MTIKRYAGDKIVGVSGDTKPTAIPDGATFYESDTLREYLLVSGSWTLIGVSGFSGYSGSIGLNTASDDFNRAALGTTNWQQQSGIGGGSGFSGLVVISGSVAAAASGADDAAVRWIGSAFSVNQYSQATIKTVAGWSDDAQVAVRCQVTDNLPGCYSFSANPGGGYFRLYRVGNDRSFNTLATYTHAPADDDVIRIEVNGNGITGLVNGVPVLTATDTTFGAGQPGIICGDVDTLLDDWSAGDLSSSGTSGYSGYSGAAGTIGGSGTSGKIAAFTDTSTLGDSPASYSGTKIIAPIFSAVAGTSDYFEAGAYARLWDPRQQIGSLTYNGSYGPCLTYNAYYSSGWKHIAAGLAGSFYHAEGYLGYSIGANGTADSSITWTDAFAITPTGDITTGTGTSLLKSAIQFVIDGGGATITTGVKGDIEIPFDCTLTEMRLLADVSGTIDIDIWADSYANFPPVNGDDIVSNAVISSATKNQYTGWSISIAAGSILRFNVNSCTTITRCTVSLTVNKA